MAQQTYAGSCQPKRVTKRSSVRYGATQTVRWSARPTRAWRFQLHATCPCVLEPAIGDDGDQVNVAVLGRASSYERAKKQQSVEFRNT